MSDLPKMTIDEFFRERFPKLALAFDFPEEGSPSGRLKERYMRERKFGPRLSAILGRLEVSPEELDGMNEAEILGLRNIGQGYLDVILSQRRGEWDPEDKRFVRIGIRMPASLLAEIDSEAEARGISRTELLRKMFVLLFLHITAERSDSLQFLIGQGNEASPFRLDSF